MKRATILVSCMAWASLALAGGVSSPRQCREKILAAHGKTLIRNVDVPCRDGDPRCDADGKCDGMCTVSLCGTIDYIGGCPFFGAGACIPIEEPWDVEQVAVGKRFVTTQYVSYALASRLRVRCLRAAPKCNYNLPGDAVGHGP
jgi:hypothetical protein